MNKLFVILSLCAGMSVAAAETVDISKLTPSQRQVIEQQVEQLQPVSSQEMVKSAREELTAWGELGANMGKATVAAAKEVGMAAGEFAQTPLGQITTAIVVYKIIGRDVIRLIIGTVLFFIVLPICLICIIHTPQRYNKTYEYKPVLFGLWNRRMLVSSSTREATRTEVSADEGKFIICVIFAGATFVSSMLIFF